jgi:hypothetical protein
MHMASYADLSPYSYLAETVPVGVVLRNVGWLGPGVEFSRGESTKEFTDALRELCVHHASARTRGWHACELDHDGTSLPYPLTLQTGDAAHPLGGAEVRVVSQDGDWLAAPDLVYHYVTDHDYLPPQEFVDAVMERRTAPQS